MKTLLATLSLLVSLSAQSAIWTFHTCKDNYTQVYLNGPTIIYPLNGGTAIGASWQACACWDWTWDVSYPESADSGFGVYEIDENKQFVELGFYDGYLDKYTLFNGEIHWPIYNNSESSFFVSICGPWPGYDWTGLADVEASIPADGDYWIDFAPDGTARVLTSEPIDFGKWSWDGSINPSWVEPEPVLLKGKGHAKRH